MTTITYQRIRKKINRLTVNEFSIPYILKKDQSINKHSSKACQNASKHVYKDGIG